MQITRIAQQAKRPDRYSVFIDGKYAFSLSEAALLEQHLHSGQQLDKAALEVYKRLSADDKLLNQALRYAAMRPRSIWEVETYLVRKQAGPEVGQTIISRLHELHLLDDAAFAQTWLANRRLLRPTSRRKLTQELRAKHVAEAIIDAVLSSAEAADEQQSLRELITKKRRQSKYQQDDLKLMQYLARQGFSYGDIKDELHDDA